MRFPSNGQASQMNGVAETAPRKTKPVGPLGARGGDYAIPQQTEGDMDAETGTETIGRIPMDRADLVEDRDFPHMHDKSNHHTKGRLAAVIGERDGQISATQRSRR
jgi:hypothetical protein